MGTYGRQVLDAASGHPLQVQADGNPIWHPVGITIDWGEVVAPTADVNIAGTVVKAGQKYLRHGQVLVKETTGKWVPYLGQPLVRSETVILNQLIIENGLLAGISVKSSDHPGVLDGGLMWKDRVLVNDPDETGVLQVETAVVVGTIGAAGAGDVEVTVTGNDIDGSPVLVLVPVDNNDADTVVAGKIRTALAANAAITEKYTVGGTGANVSLTRLAPAMDNDTTLNIAIAEGTSDGLTADAESNNTTAGVAADNGGPLLADLLAAMPLLRFV